MNRLDLICETSVEPRGIPRQPPEAQAIIRILLAHIATLKDKIEQLEARLIKTPRNSSKPPSGEHPHAKPDSRKLNSDRGTRRTARADNQPTPSLFTGV